MSGSDITYSLHCGCCGKVFQSKYAFSETCVECANIAKYLHPEPTPPEMRTFTTGGTRNTDAGKYCYEGFLSPVVLERFAAYMHGHRIQADGKLRAPDNWQKHFGEDHFSVCMDSLIRHMVDMWLEHRGFKSREGIENAMMGVLFNVQAYADKFYKDKLVNESPNTRDNL